MAGELIDVTDPLLRYRIDSVPGTVGCPIFDGQWKVVGLHHGSVSDTGGPGATPLLGEGISIEAIRRRLSSALRQDEPENAGPVNVFISYAHHDESMVNAIARAPKVAGAARFHCYWHDRRIKVGEAWDQEVSSQLKRADIVILAFSSRLVASYPPR